MKKSHQNPNQATRTLNDISPESTKKNKNMAKSHYPSHISNTIRPHPLQYFITTILIPLPIPSRVPVKHKTKIFSSWTIVAILFKHCSVMYFINTFRCYPARLRPELVIMVIIPSHDIYSPRTFRILPDCQLGPKACWITAKCIDKIHDRTMLEEHGNSGTRACSFFFG